MCLNPSFYSFLHCMTLLVKAEGETGNVPQLLRLGPHSDVDERQ